MTVILMKNLTSSHIPLSEYGYRLRWEVVPLIHRRKWQVALGALLAAALLTAGVVYAEQAPSDGQIPSSGLAQVLTEIRELRQKHMEALKAEIEQVIEKAVDAGTITRDEADRLSRRPLGTGWDRHGHRGTGPFRMGGRLWSATPEEVQGFLDGAVEAGRLTREQADRLLERWNACRGRQ